MWAGFTHYSIWILVIAGLVIFLLLLFSDRVRSLISKLEPEKWHKKAFGGIDFIFWTIEIIAVILMVLAFIAITLSHEGVHEIITAQTIQAWFLEHGINNVIVLIVGVMLWLVLLYPPVD